MSELRFSCPHCGQHVVCDDELANAHAPCPSCAIEITIPRATQPVLSSAFSAEDNASTPTASCTSPSQTAGQAEEVVTFGSHGEVAAFRRTARILGTLALMLGALNVSLGALVVGGGIVVPDGTPRYAAILSLTLGAALLAGGLGSIFRQTWSFYIVLVVAYLIILSAVLDAGIGRKPAILAALTSVILVWRGHAALIIAGSFHRGHEPDLVSRLTP